MVEIFNFCFGGGYDSKKVDFYDNFYNVCGL